MELLTSILPVLLDVGVSALPWVFEKLSSLIFSENEAEDEQAAAAWWENRLGEIFQDAVADGDVRGGFSEAEFVGKVRREIEGVAKREGWTLKGAVGRQSSRRKRMGSQPVRNRARTTTSGRAPR